MTFLGLSEKSQAIRYAMSTINVAEVLCDISGESQITLHQKVILQKGAGLIRQVIDGAMLVEGKVLEADALPSEQSLSAYGYALSTLQMLNLINSMQGYTEYFKDLLAGIENIIAGNTGEVSLGQIKSFFLMLSEAFREDIEKDRYIEPTDTLAGLGRFTSYATSLA